MHADAIRVVHQRLAAKAQPVSRLLRDVLNRLLGVLDRARTGLDELAKVSGRHRRCELIRKWLVLRLPGQLRVGTVQIDDLVTLYSADSAVRPENYDLHVLPRFQLRLTNRLAGRVRRYGPPKPVSTETFSIDTRFSGS